MIHLFCGYDEREAIGFQVFASSLLRTCSAPVSITPIGSNILAACGTNAFTYARFLVPWFMKFQGHAIFVDGSDMLMTGDLMELAAIDTFDSDKAVSVVKHPYYISRHPKKYVGTEMESPNMNYSRKNWASVMLINCAHPSWSKFTPWYVEKQHDLSMLQLADFKPSEIGELNPHWNVLVDEGQVCDKPKILHWTAGIPGFAAYRHAPYADKWHEEVGRIVASGNSGPKSYV